MHPTDHDGPIEAVDRVEAEELLEAVLVAAIADLDLPDLLDDLALAPLTNTAGTPVRITGAASFGHEGVLTLDRGVVVHLSDGSQYTLAIRCYRRPDDDINENTDENTDGTGNLVVPVRRRRRGGQR